MLRLIASLILKIAGWKMKGEFPFEAKKAVIMIAPHTSNWDYIIGRMFFFKLNVRVKFLIKKEIFVFPIGGLIKYWGGIPVDRGKSNRVVVDTVALFNKYDSLYLAVTPEGTRKLVKHWRRGFYYIALKANVPIAPSFIDYKKKEVGLMELFTPTGDYAKDLEYLQGLYKGVTARHPEKFNLTGME